MKKYHSYTVEGAVVEGQAGVELVVLVDTPEIESITLRLTGLQVQQMQALADGVADRLRRQQNEKWG